MAYIIKDCLACNGFGCRGCNHKGRVRVKTPPNPPMRCRPCNGTGCGSCRHTGWMNGYPLPD